MTRTPNLLGMGDTVLVDATTQRRVRSLASRHTVTRARALLEVSDMTFTNVRDGGRIRCGTLGRVVAVLDEVDAKGEAI